MKTIEQIQKENRKFILEAIHGCSYEEALKKEIGFGCDILVEGEYRNFENGKHKWGKGLITIDSSVYIDEINLKEGLIYTAEFSDEKIIEVIGKPITLNRVLLAFKNRDARVHNKTFVFSYAWERFYPLIEDEESSAYPAYKLWNLFGFDWDLTSETLEEQSEETQRGINKLFND